MAAPRLAFGVPCGGTLPRATAASPAGVAPGDWRLARLVQGAFYAVMLAMPLVGSLKHRFKNRIDVLGRVLPTREP